MTETAVLEVMQAHATAGVFWAREMFEPSLDYSEASLYEVEQILGRLRDRLPQNRLTRLIQRRQMRREMLEIAIVWGSYVGEVMRRHGAGEWQVSHAKRANILATSLQLPAITAFPIQAIYHWLSFQSPEGIWDYYKRMIQAQP